MKLISYLDRSGSPCTGAVVDGHVVDLGAELAAMEVSAASRALAMRTGVAIPATGMLRLLQAGSAGLDRVRARIEAARRSGGLADCPALAAVALLAPVPRPGKIVAIGRNYADHAKETGVKPSEKPRIIGKLSSSVTAPREGVKIPAAVTKLDFEAELAVVIGDFGSRVARSDALNIVAGYTILNDVSAREFQFDVSPPQTTFAKSMDGFTPMGPWIVTQDEIPDPRDLQVSSWLNGELMQRGSTSDLLFPVDVLIEYLSGFMTLEPGDIIATGTPAGSGAFRTPPVYLKAGDRLRFEISRIGVMEHDIL
jgi:2-keto-4-pentenoate hydratase/2-oxohepta-3-ene-1,7-dioic acid hydratase in catechol pathway